MRIEEVWPEWSAVGASIGEGSYGVVYKCVCHEDNEEKYSAIKVISVPQDDINYSSLSAEKQESIKAEYKEIVDGFLNEIKILETLKGNKNIVAIEDSKVVEREDGIGWQIFIRMELLTDLEKYLKEHTFEKEDILRLGIDLCQALKACGEKKIIHRDIKPSNIFIDSEGNFKLGDFGVAKQLERTMSALTKTGTPDFMSPEVWHAQKYNSCADIYSLALVMYKLFNNNRMPFLRTEKQLITLSEKESAFSKRIEGEKIPPIRNLDENINTILLKALEFKQEDRFKTVEEFETALKRCAQGKRTKKSFKQIAENSVITKAVSIILVATIVSTALAVYLNHRPELKKEPETIIVNESTTAEATAATNTTKENTTKETTTEESTIKKTTEKTSTLSLKQKVVQEYKKIIDKNKYHYSYEDENGTETESVDLPMYAFYDFNKDNIPELLIWDKHVASAVERIITVYMFDNETNQVMNIGTMQTFDGHGWFGESADKDGIVISTRDSGNDSIIKYSLGDSKIVSFIMRVKIDESFDEWERICYSEEYFSSSDIEISGNNSYDLLYRTFK